MSQSPKSGQRCFYVTPTPLSAPKSCCLNPLNRVNGVSIMGTIQVKIVRIGLNPLNRVNGVSIAGVLSA